MTRRRFASFLVTGAPASYPCFFEPRWLTVTRTLVTLSRRPLSEAVRILHLSDFHLSLSVPLGLIENGIGLGLKERPDVICVTGDFITGREEFSSGRYARALTRLASAAPTFAVLGNHDGGIWAADAGGYADSNAVRAVLTASGIQLLHNTSARIRIRSTALSLVGVGDLWLDEALPAVAFSGVDSDEAIVLLAHNPDTKDIAALYPWDLMLSGHTHGGQVLLPFVGPRFAPVVDKRYVSGLRSWGSRQIHVSRGVGSVGGVRLRCRPEVNLLTLK